jgi:hypothetical protein
MAVHHIGQEQQRPDAHAQADNGGNRYEGISYLDNVVNIKK